MGDTPLPAQLQELSIFLESEPHSLVSENSQLHSASLNAAKFLFDFAVESEAGSIPHIQSLLESLSPAEAPQTRSQARTATKRKRSPTPSPTFNFLPTPLPSLYVKSQDDAQIWSQLDLRANSLCQLLDRALLQGEEEEEDPQLPGMSEEELDEFDFPESDGMDETDSSSEVDDDDSESSDVEERSDSPQPLGERMAELQDPSSDEESDPGSSSSDHESATFHAPRKGSRSELDDGFFDLATFNAETEETEARNVTSGHLDEDEEDDLEEVDLFAHVDMAETFDEDDLEEQQEPFYKDFFDPPPQSRRTEYKLPRGNKPKTSVRFHDEVRVKDIKPRGKNAPLNSVQNNIVAEGSDEEEGDDDADDDDGVESDGHSEDDGDIEVDEESESETHSESKEYMNRMDMLQMDLFAEDENDTNMEDGLTNHQKRVNVLQDQIAELEANNVGEKDWVLMGEATARARPQNSLLEEHLEYERVMKSVPLVTEEAIHSLEERIKTRITEGNFDDVVRLRPLEERPFLPSRFLELSDKKSADSIAQIYEKEYIAERDDQTTGGERDEKLAMEHKDIEVQWEDICFKLDALCNAHYMPKQPKAAITTMSNVATASLESALPTVKSASTMLAPEEIFAPSSSSRARSELDPAEKKALHRKLRKAKQKARDTLAKGVEKSAKSIHSIKKQKRDALAGVVKKGKGVTVIGKDNKKKSRPSRSSS